MTARILSQSYLKKILSYDPETGVFTREKKTSNATKIGDVVGSVNADGYLIIGIAGKRMYAHRLAWLYMYGHLPEQLIDHINHDKADNRIANLRESSHSQNKFNQPAHKDCLSGVKGVSCTKYGKWRARARVNGKDVLLGNFNTKNEAAEAYRDFESRHHREFAFSEKILPK